MNEIECVRIENASALLDSYFKKLIKDVGLQVKFIDWKTPKVSKDQPLILVASSEQVKALLELISTRDHKIIIALNSRKDFKLVSEFNDHFDKIFGFIDLSQEVEYNTPLLKNYLSLNFSNQAVKLDNLESDLDKIYESTKSELLRIKDIHERLVKVRVDKLKGVTLLSKFMVGEKNGGEFFEVIQNDQEILYIQAGSNSYLLSSLILSEIENIKEKSATTKLQSLIEQFIKVVELHAVEKKSELTYCMMILNLKTLEAKFSLKGQAHLFYSNELLTFDHAVVVKLKPRDRLLIISQGAMENWKILSKLSPEKFFLENQTMESRDFINEFFFEVSRNKAGSFLIYDALMAVVEVEERVLYQLP